MLCVYRACFSDRPPAALPFRVFPSSFSGRHYPLLFPLTFGLVFHSFLFLPSFSFDRSACFIRVLSVYSPPSLSLGHFIYQYSLGWLALLKGKVVYEVCIPHLHCAASCRRGRPYVSIAASHGLGRHGRPCTLLRFRPFGHQFFRLNVFVLPSIRFCIA